jgi:hypothetical protein
MDHNYNKQQTEIPLNELTNEQSEENLQPTLQSIDEHMRMLIGMFAEHGERLAQLEARSSRSTTPIDAAKTQQLNTPMVNRDEDGQHYAFTSVRRDQPKHPRFSVVKEARQSQESLKPYSREDSNEKEPLSEDMEENLLNHRRQSQIYAASQPDPQQRLVQRLEFDQRRVESVSQYFTRRHSLLEHLTFYDYFRWRETANTYQRSFESDWKHTWFDSFHSTIRRQLRIFNFTPWLKDKPIKIENGMRIGAIFVSTDHSSSVGEKLFPSFIKDGHVFNQDTQLSELPIANVVSLLELAVCPFTKVEFRTALIFAMKSNFKIDMKNKDCSLKFKSFERTTSINLVNYYPAYKEFLGQCESFYLSLLDLQRKAKQQGRNSERPTYREAEGLYDTLMFICKSAGATFLCTIMSMIKTRPNPLMQDTLRDIMVKSDPTHQKKINPVYDDEDPYEPAQRVRSLKVLFHLLNAELDAQYFDSHEAYQKLQESLMLDKSIASSHPDGQRLVQTLYLDTRDPFIEQPAGDEIISTLSPEESMPVLQSFTSGSKKSEAVPLANKVCYRGLMGLKCPPDSGKPCPGHNNNSVKDKALAVESLIPRFEDEIKWRQERLAALRKNQVSLRHQTGERRQTANALTLADQHELDNMTVDHEPDPESEMTTDLE